MPLTTERISVTVANAALLSSAFEMPDWASFCSVYFPTMNDGDIGIEITRDGGFNYYPLLKPDGSADFVACASGFDPAWIDISDRVRALPNQVTHNILMRFTCAAQTGIKQLYVYFKE